MKKEITNLIKPVDYFIIGAGIMGLTIARELKKRYPHKAVCVAEKEAEVAMHASGRNSGVLHAGFYYTSDSLKARFTREGNKAMSRYCEENGLKINKCGKIIVANDEGELAGLEELKRRGDRNGVELIWLSAEEARKMDSNVRTHIKALYSPNTSSVDPMQVCRRMQVENEQNGVEFLFHTIYLRHDNNRIFTNRGVYECEFVINAAGLYADKIAHDYGFGKKYTIIPFKGIFLKYNKNKSDVVTNIYPVPNLENPFLGVHFTKTVDNSIKIGPTAIPVFWRENYSGFHRFNAREFIQIIYYQAKLFRKNAFNFRRLAFEEMKKYKKKHLIDLSFKMINQLDPKGFDGSLKPGIRAQLLNKETLELVQDFVLEGDHQSIHILNAVSPAFTCSIPFAEHVVNEIAKKQEANSRNRSTYQVKGYRYLTRSGR
ncbi:L-2-hydroxyglutarate oxidase [Cohnella terricola]|uniref:L-2-hydroxyglutarate oxidase n=1 Tax=Cohnella terricola TaxID=1289167 RepID=A0A559JMM8_9BACL|nr:L-2-hydroxyglutarate oxidase [Cohnella terricola]TVY01116.1 L-2-hydroxyglutarate oxidase [Cohnella terricola]